MTYEEAYRKLSPVGQEHLLEYYEELNGQEKKSLLQQIEELDISLLDLTKDGVKEVPKGKLAPLGALTLEEIDNKKEEFVTFQAKLMRRFCSNALLSALIVAGLYLFVWKRRLGDVIVKVLENCLNIEHEAAFLIYHEYFRGHKEVFFGVAIVLIFLWLLWRLFWWMSNYFKEINQGIDSLLAEDNRFNSQQISLSKELVDLSLMLAQLSDKLARVFGNLLKNAAAYSYPQTEITIFATSSEDLVSISVQNKGATIPAENLPLLFDKFYRLDEARMSNTGGTGLGLAITLPATK